MPLIMPLRGKLGFSGWVGEQQDGPELLCWFGGIPLSVLPSKSRPSRDTNGQDL